MLAGDRVLGRWRLPAEALSPGWLALDLPEPAPPGPAEARLEILADGEGAPPLLSASSAEPQASLALRANIAPPGWSVLPRHFDWAASFTARPALPLPFPETALAAATAEGAEVALVAAGEETPRLVMELVPQAAAMLRLPPVPVGPADLLRARIALTSASGNVSAAVTVTADGGTTDSGWRSVAPSLPLAIPLPPGPMAWLDIALRNAGAVPAVVEVSALALMLGAVGEPRRLPPPEPLPASRLSLDSPTLRRAASAAPVIPPSQMQGAGLPSPSAIPGSSHFREIKLHQHLISTDAGYRHLDVAVSGLVSGGAFWRQLRLKLFERRGTVGLEFRNVKGWPAMFDTWPGSTADQYGPLWRLETGGIGAALARLATPHDRSVMVALLDQLPEIAGRAAKAAGLPAAEREEWIARARQLLAAVAAARQTD